LRWIGSGCRDAPSFGPGDLGMAYASRCSVTHRPGGASRRPRPRPRRLIRRAAWRYLGWPRLRRGPGRRSKRRRTEAPVDRPSDFLLRWCRTNLSTVGEELQSVRPTPPVDHGPLIALSRPAADRLRDSSSPTTRCDAGHERNRGHWTLARVSRRGRWGSDQLMSIRRPPRMLTGCV